MSTAQDAVSAALEQALSGGQEGAESQSAESSPEAKPDTTSQAPSDAKTESTQEKPDSKVESKTVPYDRFSEVVSQKNEAQEKIKSLENLFEGATKREDQLRSRVGELEQEHQILDAIRALAKDERYRSHVTAIDKALQGIEEEVEEAKASGDDKALEKAQKQFSDKTAELEGLIAEQKAESLWDVSNQTAAQMLEALPEEYTDVDKARLSQMWTPRVDWNKIEEGGREAIAPELQNTLAQLIKDYGAPSGAVAKQTREEVLKSVPQAADASLTAEQKVEKILGKDWSKVDEKGNAELSDADFSKDMANLLKVTRGG